MKFSRTCWSLLLLLSATPLALVVAAEDATTATVTTENTAPSKTFTQGQTPVKPTKPNGGKYGTATKGQYGGGNTLNGHGYMPNKQAPPESPFGQVSGEDMTACIQDTRVIMMNTVIQQDATALDNFVRTQPVECPEAVTKNALGMLQRTCQLDLRGGVPAMPEACGQVNGTYLETDHTLICSVSGIKNNGMNNKNGGGMNHGNNGMMGGGGGGGGTTTTKPSSTEVASIIFNFVGTPDCLGMSCNNNTGAILETKSIHRLAAAMMTRLTTATTTNTMPFSYQAGSWVCHVDLEGTNAHVGSTAHQVFQDQIEASKEDAKKQAEAEEAKAELEGASSSAATGGWMFLAVALVHGVLYSWAFY